MNKEFAHAWVLKYKYGNGYLSRIDNTTTDFINEAHIFSYYRIAEIANENYPSYIPKKIIISEVSDD